MLRSSGFSMAAQARSLSLICRFTASAGSHGMSLALRLSRETAQQYRRCLLEVMRACMHKQQITSRRRGNHI